MSDDLDPRLTARFERELAAVPAYRVPAIGSRTRPRWQKFAVLGTAGVVALVRALEPRGGEPPRHRHAQGEREEHPLPTAQQHRSIFAAGDVGEGGFELSLAS